MSTIAFRDCSKEQVVPVHPDDSNGIMLLPMAVAGGRSQVQVLYRPPDRTWAGRFGNGVPAKTAKQVLCTGGLGGDLCPLR